MKLKDSSRVEAGAVGVWRRQFDGRLKRGEKGKVQKRSKPQNRSKARKVCCREEEQSEDASAEH